MGINLVLQRIFFGLHVPGQTTIGNQSAYQPATFRTYFHIIAFLTKNASSYSPALSNLVQTCPNHTASVVGHMIIVFGMTSTHLSIFMARPPQRESLEEYEPLPLLQDADEDLGIVKAHVTVSRWLIGLGVGIWPLGVGAAKPCPPTIQVSLQSASS